jgi:hypothetical protein
MATGRGPTALPAFSRWCVTGGTVTLSAARVALVGATGNLAMIALRIGAVMLVACGVLVLLFGGSSDAVTVLEPVDLSVWAGVTAILFGTALMLLAQPKP